MSSYPIRDFALKIAEGVLDEYRSQLRDHAQVSEHGLCASNEDCDNARAAALQEVRDALETYGIVAGYPRLIEAAEGLLTMWKSSRTCSPDEWITAFAALDKALHVSAQDVYLGNDEPTQPSNVSDITLPF